MYRFRKAALLCTLVCGLTTFAGRASASPGFPTAVQDELGLPCTPSCSLCHSVDPGTPGTAKQPFARIMLQSGLAPANDSSVAEALADYPEQEDSDGDGTPDLEELTGGASPASGDAGASSSSTGVGDPNDPSPSAVLCGASDSGPQYGCGAHVAPRASGLSPLWGLVALAAGVVVSTLRRRRLRGRGQV